MKREGLVWLVSYPRSGVTWMRYLLLAILYPNEEIGVSAVDRLLPDASPFGVIERFKVQDFSFAKSHDIYRLEYNKVIYIYRDGRDVAVSFYYYLQHISHSLWKRTIGISFQQFLVERFLIGYVPFGQWNCHVKFWLEIKHGIEFLPIRYEELWRKPYDTMKEVLDFLDETEHIADVQIGIDKTSFGKRKIQGARDGEHPNLIGLRGKPGGWKEEFTEKQHSLFWQKFGKTMEKLGYKKE